MIDWDAERDRLERELVNPIFQRWLKESYLGRFMPAPPPTREETIKAAWHGVRDLWPTTATDGGLIVEHDLGIVPSILFEQRRYGDTFVIEAEGVIVERNQIKSPPSSR